MDADEGRSTRFRLHLVNPKPPNPPRRSASTRVHSHTDVRRRRNSAKLKRMTDLPTLAFLALRKRFFDEGGRSLSFDLRAKLNTQDDPLDEFLAQDVLAAVPGVSCCPAPGPLVAPDIVLHRSTVSRAEDLRQIVGVEVKKLERTAQGRVARATGLDYNTTPPCGRIRVYDEDVVPIHIRAFYLFVCLEPAPGDGSRMIVSALALVDGNVLNEDFDLYLAVTGEREKRIGLGTFADGADRTRPMLIFGNPLGIREFDHAATLVHSDHALADSSAKLKKAYVLKRSVGERGCREFPCYRTSSDLEGRSVTTLIDPFPKPARDTRTRPRGRFILSLRTVS